MQRQLTARALACAMLLACGSAAAQSSELARAMALQPPVWIERGEVRAPLYPGAAVQPGDRLATGSGGRIHLELEDSSTIQIGEGASFELPALQVVDDGSETGLLKGALKVVKGAFRYTTGALSQFRKRELDVYVGPTITSGIRGTDIFAKSDDTQDLLCLLEGSVPVSGPDGVIQTMDQPNSFFVVPRGQPPRPIGPAPQAKLASWLPSTELRGGEPAMKAGGRFRLVLISVGTERQAQGEALRLANLGYPVEVMISETPAGIRHRVVLGGFASYNEAQAYRRVVTERLKLGGSWVMRP